VAITNAYTALKRRWVNTAKLEAASSNHVVRDEDTSKPRWYREKPNDTPPNDIGQVEAISPNRPSLEHTSDTEADEHSTNATDGSTTSAPKKEPEHHTPP
jgi:hypothetical protein